MRADYKCEKCKFVWEYKKSVGEDFPKILQCPDCGRYTGKRVFSINNVIVKTGYAGSSRDGYTGKQDKTTIET